MFTQFEDGKIGSEKLVALEPIYSLADVCVCTNRLFDASERFCHETKRAGDRFSLTAFPSLCSGGGGGVDLCVQCLFVHVYLEQTSELLLE